VKKDFTLLQIDQLEEIGKKLWGQVEAGEWGLSIDTVEDFDINSETTLLCYGVYGKHKKNGNTFVAFPDSIPSHACCEAFVLVIGKQKFVSQHFPRSIHFNLLNERVKNLVRVRKAEDKKKKEEKERAALKKSGEELFKSIIDLL